MNITHNNILCCKKLELNCIPVNISCFPRRLQDVFSVTLFVFQDLLKTSSRRLPRRVCKTSCNYAFKTSSRRPQDVLEDKKCYTEDVLKTCVFSTSSPRRMFAGIIVQLYNYSIIHLNNYSLIIRLNNSAILVTSHEIPIPRK